MATYEEQMEQIRKGMEEKVASFTPTLKKNLSKDEKRAKNREEARVRNIKKPRKKQKPPSREQRIAYKEVARRKRNRTLNPEKCYFCETWDRPTINHVTYLPEGQGLNIIWLCSEHTAQYKAAQFCLWRSENTKVENIALNSPMIKGMFVIDGKIK